MATSLLENARLLGMLLLVLRGFGVFLLPNSETSREQAAPRRRPARDAGGATAARGGGAAAALDLHACGASTEC